MLCRSILAFVTARPVIRALLNQPHKKALDLVNSEYLLIQRCDMCDLQSADRDMKAAGLAPLSHVKETISCLSEMKLAGRAGLSCGPSTKYYNYIQQGKAISAKHNHYGML